MTKEEIAIQALEDIANPIAYLQREAEKNDEKLDWNNALKLSESTFFFQEIARKALGKIKP